MLIRSELSLPGIFDLRFVSGDLPKQKDLGCAASASFRAEEPCREHACLVCDEQVAWANVFHDVAEYAVLECAGNTVHDQHLACVAYSSRRLRNQLIGQFVFEISSIHKSSQPRGSKRHSNGRDGRSGILFAGARDPPFPPVSLRRA